jgi:D-alanyl-D-alanine carboxypeptidase
LKRGARCDTLPAEDAIELTRRFLVSTVLPLVFSVAWALYPTATSPTAALQKSLAPLKDNPPPAGRMYTSSAKVPAHPPPPPRRLTAGNTVLAYPPPPVMARAAYLIDLKTGQVLFAKNANQRLPMASTTKITTAMVVLQHAKLHDLAWVSKRAATIGESTMVLARGEQLTVEQLLYGLLLNSANDAAITLAEHVSGNEERFVGLMNQLARRLHMRNTHYVTAHGLDAPGHYTSAHDLAVISRYAMRNATFRRIVATVSYHIPKTKYNAEHWLASVNRLLYWFPGIDGVKPGDTDNAGLCQVVSDWRNGRHVLAVLLNTPNLVTDARNLLDYGGRDFRWVQDDVYWDAPYASLAGSGTHGWVYYLGAGHYIRDLFLAYFRSHGGLRALGYPRTEAIVENGRRVQYFQGAKLVFDPVFGTVYPEPLGAELASRIAPRALRHIHHPGATFGGLYKRLGGRHVLGIPVTNKTWVHGTLVQFFQYGELARVNGRPMVVPLGDALLRTKGWLPSVGAADAVPSDLTSSPIT